MPVSRFDEHLPLLLDDKGEQVGICLMGPVGNGETLVWMSGWAWQQDGENVVAASTGDAGVPVKGAHPPPEGRCGVRGDLRDGGAVQLRMDDGFWMCAGPAERMDEEMVAGLREEVLDRIRDLAHP